MSKVTVKLKASFAGPSGIYGAGQTCSVDRHRAERMVKKGEAEIVEDAEEVKKAVVGNNSKTKAKPSGKAKRKRRK